MSKSRTPPSKHGSKSPPLGLSMQDLKVEVKVEERSVVTSASDVKSETTPKLEDPSPTPPVVSNIKPGPQLIGDLPRAETEALNTFVEIQANHYQYGTLGRSRETLESMTCDCQYEPGVDSSWLACGHGSDCINRLTQVECLPDDCRCRSFCQNQRFQRREYATIEIVQTEKKGFGLRAAKDLDRDAFIYEYVGDVVSQPSFMKRMRDYAQEGIRHFYFMMLQKDEFIDATKRGGIGRFANHSCNPNCYVAKWTVGHHVRMGIFANRKIQKYEELTFNYNVDRYGHEAQPCYCGEPKCVGFIGGKTQTDIAAMDDLYLDALGITDEVDRLGLKGSKKKKSKKLDEDFTPILKPIIEKDVPKVVQAVRQTQSRKVLFKLLTRIKITEDQSALRQLMRLRGFSLMTNILEDYEKDVEITALVLECMVTWPLLQRNKVDDSKITVPVSACAESDNEVIKVIAQKLLDHWNTLETAYRIPKRMKQDGSEEDQQPVPEVSELENMESRPFKRSRYDDLIEEVKLDIKPLGFKTAPLASVNSPTPRGGETPAAFLPRKQATREEIAAVIAAASAAATAAQVKPPEPPAEESNGKKKKKEKRHQTQEEKEANKEKRLLKLVGAVVVKCMSKHQKQMDHDLFKKHAKDLTHIIAEKEKKSSSYKEDKLDALSEEKVTKIKKFAKEYIAKVLRKLEKAGARRKHPVATSSATPNSTGGGESGDPDFPMGGMTVEEAMDMDADSGGSGDEGDAMDYTGGQNDTALPRDSGCTPSPVDPSPWRESVQVQNVPAVTAQAADPRLRPKSEEKGNGWDPQKTVDLS